MATKWVEHRPCMYDEHDAATTVILVRCAHSGLVTCDEAMYPTVK